MVPSCYNVIELLSSM